MDTATAAQITGKSAATIRRWCRTGRIRATKTDRRWIIDATTITGETTMIETVKHETRRRDWRGQDIVTITEYAKISGTVTAIAGTDAHPGIGHLPIYTIQTAGQSVTAIAPNGGIDTTTMTTVQVGDTVEILAELEPVDGRYTAAIITRH